VEPGDHVGSYTLIARLGRGASAEVWRARHRALGSHHAVKILSVDSPGMAARMVREGRVQARLRHPNIVPVTDLVQAPDQVALVMELIEGGTLRRRLEQGGPMPPERARAVLRALLDALDLAHRAGVLHRDLKLDNVLMDGEIPRIADFGLARVESGERGMTRAGQPMGTPGYMPPEQWADPSDLDARADLFALGVVAFELLTCASPYDGEDPTAILSATIAGRRRDLRALAPGVDEAMAAAIERALAPRREDRFPDCRAMAEALGIPLGPPAALPPLAGEALESLEAPAPTAGTLLAMPEDDPPAPRTLAPDLSIDAGPGVLDGGAAGRVAPADHAPGPPAPARRGQALAVAVLAVAALGVWALASGSGEPGEAEPPPARSAAPDDADRGDEAPPAADGDRAERPPPPCVGGEDELLGYWFAGRRFSAQVGEVITVSVDSDVREDHPSAENGYNQDLPIVCRLPAGQEVRLRDAPIQERWRRVWLPLYGGDLLGG
jgi:hypothetical protein